jgi:serine/threonine protein kinase
LPSVAEIISVVSSLKDIKGIYDSHQLVGTGGGGHFSVLFKARHIADRRLVALKFLVDHGDAYRRSSFDRESAVAHTVLNGDHRFVQLVSPVDLLVVPLSTSGTSAFTINWEAPFIAFEWLPGGDLSKFATKTAGRRELLAKLAVFEAMCASVARAHLKGCFHRDLKPPNFMLDGDRVKLGDFGTAKVTSLPPLLHTYTFAVGDIRYTAPEMLAGIDADRNMWAAADAYSMGAILFELLTGQVLASFIFGSLINISSFVTHLRTVPEARRPAIFDGLLASLAVQLPDVRKINPDLPRCSYPLLTRLLEMLSAFDYRQREFRFEHIRRVVRMCRIVVENEDRYLVRLARRKGLSI